MTRSLVKQASFANGLYSWTRMSGATSSPCRLLRANRASFLEAKILLLVTHQIRRICSLREDYEPDTAAKGTFFLNFQGATELLQFIQFVRSASDANASRTLAQWWLDTGITANLRDVQDVTRKLRHSFTTYFCQLLILIRIHVNGDDGEDDESVLGVERAASLPLSSAW